MSIYGILRTADERQLMLDKLLEILPPVDQIAPGKRLMYKKQRKSVRTRILRGKSIGFSVGESNSKTGFVTHFSLPAGGNFRLAACPGASDLCEELCYAQKGHFGFHELQYWINWAFVLLWPDRFVSIWTWIGANPVVRAHIGGDFFDPGYVRLWMEIARNRPELRFYAYTRSWRTGTGRTAKRFVKVLRELSELRNFRLLLSCDSETGIPDRDLVPAAMRAWLARNDDDMPPEPVELIFRDPPKIKKKMNHIQDTPVCPVERSADYHKASGKINCQNCSWCWSTGHMAYEMREDDPSRFDEYSGTRNLKKRVKAMFTPFWPKGPGLAGHADDPDCVCGVAALCGYCQSCVGCLCVCQPDLMSV